MDFVPSGYLIVLSLTALLTASLAVFALQYRATPGATPLGMLLFGQTIWCICAAGVILNSGTAWGLIWSRLTYVGVVTVVAGLVVFTLEFTGRTGYLGPKAYAVLAVEPVLFLTLATSNPGEIVWVVGGDSAVDMSGWVMEPGPVFWLHTLYSYTLIAVSFGLLIRFVTSSDRIYRNQTYAVLAGTLIPVVGNILYLFGDVPVDLTPVAFSFTAVALTWAVHSADFLDLSPVAHTTVVDSLNSAVFVVDVTGRLVEANATAHELFGADLVVGNQVRDLLTSDPDFSDSIRSATGETRFEVEHDGRYFDVHITPLFDSRDRLVGRVVLVHDLTRQRNRELELERSNRHLDRFASVVSHDLRNPLQVAAGNLELARETGDEASFDRVEAAHERMGSIIDGVLTLSRDDDAETEQISLAGVAADAWDTVETGDAVLVVDVDDEILANRPQLLQLFENLFRNAVEHGSTNPRSSSTREDAVEHGSTSHQQADDAVEHGSTSADSHTRRDAGEVNASGCPVTDEHSSSNSRSSSTHENAVERGSTNPRSSSTHENAAEGDSENDRRSSDRDLDAGAPSVTVTVGSTANGFYVADDGPGIPADVHENVFEHGYSGTDSGTGLGLSIVDHVATVHGWTVSVGESETGGARFEVTGVSPVRQTDG